MNLETFFAQNPRCGLAFSGGVDSAYLLAEGLRLGAELCPYFVKTAFQPAFELADAQKLCAGLGVQLTVLEQDVLSCPQVVENPADRCYHCKRLLFSALRQRAAADGFSVLLDGTNASDDADDRPGMRALRELEVRSPLREAGLTKAEIRERSHALGLFTWNKPAYACLATRIPTGQPLTAELLLRVEQAENILFELGFRDFRVRVFHGCARIQLPQAQLTPALERREVILTRLAPLFDGVLLDLETRG